MARTKAALKAGARLSDYLSASSLARVYPAEMIGEILDQHGCNSKAVFDELKTHMLQKRRVLRSKTADLVRQEFYGWVLAHYAVHWLMHQAATGHRLPQRSLSFTANVQLFRFNSPGSSLCNTFVFAHRKFPAHPGPVVVDRTFESGSVQRCTPAVCQPRHGLAAPFVQRDEMVGHAGVGNQHDFQPATVGPAGCTGDFGIRLGQCFKGHPLLFMLVMGIDLST